MTWALTALLVLALAGCSSSPSVDPADADTLDVGRASLGEQWSLTVVRGSLACFGSEGSGAVVFTAPSGEEYAVNDVATSRGFKAIDPIRADDAEIEGAKRDLGPLVEAGLELCE